MLPSVDASTWALGNHKWKKKIGNFIKNAKIANKKNVFFNDKKNFLKKKEKFFPFFIIKNNKGNLPKKVYKIKYFPAFNRSGVVPFIIK